ncbi:MAG: hypothetical protein AMXMBFR61_25150 [Fimbriimonadales bacterium]
MSNCLTDGVTTGLSPLHVAPGFYIAAAMGQSLLAFVLFVGTLVIAVWLGGIVLGRLLFWLGLTATAAARIGYWLGCAGWAVLSALGMFSLLFAAAGIPEPSLPQWMPWVFVVGCVLFGLVLVATRPARYGSGKGK